MACSRKLELVFVDSEHLEEKHLKASPPEYHLAMVQLCKASGVIVPGGFGTRGTEGMIFAASWCRKNNVPYLGICLGMQIAVIEYARNVCGMIHATSEEFEPSDERREDWLIVSMPEIDKKTMGATMRLGLRPTHFQPGSEWSKMRLLYHKQSNSNINHPANGTKTPDATSTPESNGIPSSTGTADGTTVQVLRASSEQVPLTINERHRHRYEVNPEHIDKLSEAGLHFIGKDDTGKRMEILELKGNNFFVGVQFHPEYLSRVLNPSKPYLGFIAASAKISEITKPNGRKLSAMDGDGLTQTMEAVKI